MVLSMGFITSWVPCLSLTTWGWNFFNFEGSAPWPFCMIALYNCCGCNHARVSIVRTLVTILTVTVTSCCPRHQGSQSTEFHALRCGGQRDDISAELKSSSSVLRAEVGSSTSSFLLPTFISTLPPSDSLFDSDLSVHFFISSTHISFHFKSVSRSACFWALDTFVHSSLLPSTSRPYLRPSCLPSRITLTTRRGSTCSKFYLNTFDY